ncbi:unnamed protein product [Musa acuminata subsp. malaccensis]|uniref:(wild Malaysian banana) hypothetical protein n=1 Tax=Musa acuminata subsp. malaccensis TaxID=214687 RepID=A0A8D7EZB8_MUSAM|nr:unnamed protein product [Musa acuminata subsp. malaccensis]
MERTRAAAAAGSESLIATLTSATQALGRGFDVTSDARLLYCKGAPGSRLVLLDDARTESLVIADNGGGGQIVLRAVPSDVKISRDRDRRESSGVCNFQQMAEYFNKKSGLSGTVPLGSFNSMFSLTGSWKVDAAATKALAMDGFHFPLYTAKLMTVDLVLRDDVKRAVPRNWDPPSLASFIENFGTHIITSVTIGGKDEVYIKQHHSSQLSVSEIENYVKEIGDQRFLNLEHQSLNAPLNYKDKVSASVILKHICCAILYNAYCYFHSCISSFSAITWHLMWQIMAIGKLAAIPLSNIFYFSFFARTFVHQISCDSISYKPPVEELQYFLDFQVQRVWAPAPVNIPGHQRKEPVCPSLQFSLMGPKLYISSEQVSVGRKPVTGLRISLEGNKRNRLAIHIQHLAILPKILLPHWDSHVAIGPPRWQGPEEQDSRWFEPIKWKNFAHVSTAPIESNETNIGDLSGVYIVTGAQLGVWDFGARSVLHLKLLFSKVPGCTIRRSVWDHSPSTTHALKSEDTSSSASADYSKLVKIVDMTEMLKGPQDTPGHWLVTGAKLGVEKGKIVVRVKYSLLSY